MDENQKQKELLRLDRGIRRCRKCPLHRNRKHAVPGEGPFAASVMLIGEAPGRQEDEQGRPFVGPSGKYLDRMMDKAGLTRKNLYITSSVKCRPPKNRTPAAEELDICKKNWLDRQMALINPKIIVLLGRVSLNQVLGINKSLKDIHGQTFEKDARTFLPTYHPAAAMRFPKVKQKLTRDLRKLSQKSK